jgi:hypothetical protein
LLISTCIIVPILSIPIWLWFLQMHLNEKSANANDAIYAPGIIHNLRSNIHHKL